MHRILTSPVHNEEWKASMYAILGPDPEGKIYPSIDSRLRTVRCITTDVSDKFDEILHQTRMALIVEDTDSYAVFLYRLYELYEWCEDRDIVDVAGSLFSDLVMILAGDDNYIDEPWLLDYPLLPECPHCHSKNAEAMPYDTFFVDNQIYYCLNCGWQGNYQTDWPYLHDGGQCLGRLDQWVTEQHNRLSEEGRDG